MILDTSFVIDLMNGDESAVQKFKTLSNKGETQIITALTIFELFSGLARSKKAEAEKSKIISALQGQIVIHLDNDSAEKGGELHGNLAKEGKTIGVIDAMISGIALIKKEKVLTRNVKDFSRVKGLEIETY